MRLSDDLAKVCNADVLPRTEVVRAIWAYIRAHELKDPNDGRRVLCDDLLKKVCNGEKTVGIFGINKYISSHLTKL